MRKRDEKAPRFCGNCGLELTTSVRVEGKRNAWRHTERSPQDLVEELQAFVAEFEDVFGNDIRPREAWRRFVDKKERPMWKMNLKQIREWAGLTQIGVAGLMGVSQPLISDIEAGKRGRKISTLRRYIEALGGELRLVAHFGEREFTIVIGGGHD